jgi:hypothetical protein
MLAGIHLSRRTTNGTHLLYATTRAG